MAIYRFRVSFEDYEDVYREIDMPSRSTFLDLHIAIHQSTGYDSERSSSFYVSNDQWKKGTEITFLPSDRKKEQQTLSMETVKLSKFIDDPHQKFYYIYDFNRPYDLHVELIKILKEEEGKQYPFIFKTVGQAPKNTPAANFPVIDEADDLDHEPILDETEYGVDDEEDFDLFDDEEESSDSQSDQKSSGSFDEY